MTKKLYIETVGCQMNVLDSELVVGSLRRQGYELTHEPTDADVILFNTCSVRQHAEDKIYSALGRLRGHKQRHPDKVIGVLGCMAQKDQELIRRRAPHVDIVCGTGQLAQLPELIAEVEQTGKPQLALSLDRTEGVAPRGRTQLRELRSAARSVDAADAVPGVRPHHDRLRQVLHLLHRAERARPGAEPAAGAHRRRGAPARRRGLQGSHAARPDGQQLRVRPRRRPPRTAVAICCRASTTRRASSASSSSPTSRAT